MPQIKDKILNPEEELLHDYKRLIDLQAQFNNWLLRHRNKKDNRCAKLAQKDTIRKYKLEISIIQGRINVREYDN